MGILLVCGFLAVPFLVVGQVFRAQYRAARKRETLTCAELRARGPGSVLCEVTGTVGAGEGGLLRAPFSGTPCVWYRVMVTEKDAGGEKRVIRKEGSSGAFTVDDGTGVIAVLAPEGKNESVQKAAKSFDRKAAPAEAGGLPVRTGDAQWYRYEEWVLVPGRPLYACGRASFDGRRLVMDRPFPLPDGSDARAVELSSENPYLVSAGDEKALRRRALLGMAVGYGVTGALAVGGLAAFVVTAEEDYDNDYDSRYR